MGLERDAEIIAGIVTGRDPSFRGVAPEQVVAGLDGVHAAVKAEDRDGLLFAAMRLLALPANGHTRLIPNGTAQVLPLRFVGLGQDFWLTAAPTALDRFRDRRLLSVNGRPVEVILSCWNRFLAGTPQRCRVLAGLMLAWPEALARAGLKPEDHLFYDLADEEGAVETFGLPAAGHVSAEALYPVHESGFLDPSHDDYGIAGAGLVACRPLDHAVWHLRIATLSEVPASAFAQAADTVLTQATRPLVVDLRGNPGGNFLSALGLVDALADGWRGDHCAILTDKFTFSAAIVVAALLKTRLSGEVRIVGEEMGDGPRFFAEGGTVLLPATGATLRYSTAWHDWETGRPDATTPPEIADQLVAAGWLLPDETVTAAPARLRAGEDTVLARALSFARGGP